MRRFASLLLVPLVAGCGGIYDVPLPGGADLGDHPYRVTVGFRDVLDLVPQSGVKVDDVAVGRVERIGLSRDGRTAEVTVVVNGDVALPANAVARLRQSSVLGEKFVELDAPDTGATGELLDGAHIPVERTNRNPEVEEVFGALSMLLNGGGVGQLQTIVKELNLAMSGKESDLAALIGAMDTFVGGLDAHKAEITRAIDGVARLSTVLAQRTGEISAAIDGLAPGIAVLAEQREELTALLASLGTLSGVANDTVVRGRDDIVADLKALEPVLTRLTESGAKLPSAMEVLLTFPFPDSALAAIRGDYINLHLTHDTGAR